MPCWIKGWCSSLAVWRGHSCPRLFLLSLDMLESGCPRSRRSCETWVYSFRSSSQRLLLSAACSSCRGKSTRADPRIPPMSRKIGETWGTPLLEKPSSFIRSKSRRSNRHDQNVRVIDLHWTFLTIQVIPKAAPRPQLWRGNESALHRIAVNIPQLLDPLLLRPNVEIVKPCLPEPMWIKRRTWGAPGLAGVARPGHP
jgi:hypothetical protein